MAKQDEKVESESEKERRGEKIGSDVTGAAVTDIHFFGAPLPLVSQMTNVRKQYSLEPGIFPYYLSFRVLAFKVM